MVGNSAITGLVKALNQHAQITVRHVHRVHCEVLSQLKSYIY